MGNFCLFYWLFCLHLTYFKVWSSFENSPKATKKSEDICKIFFLVNHRCFMKWIRAPFESAKQLLYFIFCRCTCKVRCSNFSNNNVHLHCNSVERSSYIQNIHGHRTLTMSKLWWWDRTKIIEYTLREAILQKIPEFYEILS